MISVVLIIAMALRAHMGHAFEDMAHEFRKAMEQAEKAHGHLATEEYDREISRSHARFIFNYFDADKNDLLDRYELMRLGKMTAINDTESGEIWADVALVEDSDADERLTFAEFYKPHIVYGSTMEEKQNDPRHLHKSTRPARRREEL